MFDAFATWLREQDRSAVTIRGYLNDLAQFAEWFRLTHGQDLAPGRSRRRTCGSIGDGFRRCRRRARPRCGAA